MDEVERLRNEVAEAEAAVSEAVKRRDLASAALAAAIEASRDIEVTSEVTSVSKTTPLPEVSNTTAPSEVSKTTPPPEVSNTTAPSEVSKTTPATPPEWAYYEVVASASQKRRRVVVAGEERDATRVALDALSASEQLFCCGDDADKLATAWPLLRRLRDDEGLVRRAEKNWPMRVPPFKGGGMSLAAATAQGATPLKLGDILVAARTADARAVFARRDAQATMLRFCPADDATACAHLDALARRKPPGNVATMLLQKIEEHPPNVLLPLPPRVLTPLDPRRPSLIPNTVFVGNLAVRSARSPAEIDLALRQCFGRCGPILDVRLAEEGRGYAHIDFGDPAAAARALDLNSTLLHGRRLKVDLAEKRPQSAPVQQQQQQQQQQPKGHYPSAASFRPAAPRPRPSYHHQRHQPQSHPSHPRHKYYPGGRGGNHYRPPQQQQQQQQPPLQLSPSPRALYRPRAGPPPPGLGSPVPRLAQLRDDELDAFL